MSRGRGGALEGGDRELVDTGVNWEKWKLRWLFMDSNGWQSGLYFFDGDGTNEVGRNFTGLVGQLNVMGGQPDPLTWLVEWSLLTVVVG